VRQQSGFLFGMLLLRNLAARKPLVQDLQR
jgi:hypothetical protein